MDDLHIHQLYIPQSCDFLRHDIIEQTVFSSLTEELDAVV